MWHWSTCWDFASAGCGKTVLMHMLVNNTEADVFVIGLIGGVEGSYGMRGIAEKSVNAAKCVWFMPPLIFRQ